MIMPALAMAALLPGFPAFGAAMSDAPEPTFEINFELANLGLKVFDLSRPIENRRFDLSKYLGHPLMRLAFARYSSMTRPPDNRVDRKIYEDFVRKVWMRDYGSIVNPRMNHLVLPHYRWGVRHLDDVERDIVHLKKNIQPWLEQAVAKIPFNTPAARVGEKPVVLVFLFDPGGSYPWVHETDSTRYIYFDVLQLRGLTDEERVSPVDEAVFRGFLVHELFHQFQNDRFQSKNKADWLLGAAVGEGSAMLIGNNAFDVQGRTYCDSEPTLLHGRILAEWKGQILKVCDRINAFLELHEKWKQVPPSEDEYFKEISMGGWVAAPINGYLTGDLYRVGAQMLMDIKRVRGTNAFYEVVGDSSRLLDSWEGTSNCRRKDGKKKEVPYSIDSSRR
ncbi:MAG: hypothetical protein PHF00_03915 [Elusimicrobia bacterium]|nr:hypothetical protein [Elusimicrobiota bacterium]